MKWHTFILVFVVLFTSGPLAAQQQRNKWLSRIYVDNDYINFWGNGTDRAYTSGVRFDLFYTPENKPRFIIDRLMPKAGNGSVDVYGWGIMQAVITPSDIATLEYQPDDYPYSGALIAIHSLTSSNPVKKYNLQSELVLGVMGPASRAEEGQELLHHMIGYQLPKGWEHQLRNAPLVNINLTAEKELLSFRNVAELIGGGQVQAGSMINGIKLYGLFRTGKMRPYFENFIYQYSSAGWGTERRKRWQAYLLLKPTATLTFTNAVLTGGIGRSASDKNRPEASIRKLHPLQTLTFQLEYGFVLSKGQFGLSVTQRYSTALLKGLYDHQVGNISVFFSW